MAESMHSELTPARARLSEPDAWSHHDGSNDIWVAMRNVHVWGALGWHDIRQRYRRSVLGPFWFTLSTFIMIGVLGFLYSQLLKQDIVTYLPRRATLSAVDAATSALFHAAAAGDPAEQIHLATYTVTGPALAARGAVATD